MDIDPKRTLQYRFPEIAKEWHPTLNYPLTPKNITYGSSKKVWWQCPEVKDHIYDAIICDRTNKKTRVGCSFCRGNMRVSPERSLATLSPEIAKEWHPTLNAPLTPKDVFNSSHQKVWWQCPKNKNHVWDAIILDRTRNDKRRSKGCRICR